MINIARRKSFSQIWPFLLSLDLFNQLIVLPLFRGLTTFILQAMAVPFVSWRNIATIITMHPLALLCLLAAVVALILLFYAQAVLFICGMSLIAAGNFSWRQTMRMSLLPLKKTNLSSLFLFIAYLILFASGIELFYRTLLATKIQLFAFLLDYMTRYFWLGCLLVLLYGCCFYFGWRFIFTLPLLCLKPLSPAAALRKSWQRTQNGRQKHLAGKMLLTVTITIGAELIGGLLLIGFQKIWDLFPGKLSRWAAVLNLSFIQAVCGLALFICLSRLFFLLLAALALMPLQSEKVPAARGRHLVSLFLLCLWFALSLSSNNGYLQPPKMPLTIAHRGVDNQNGVQNTLQSLRKTSRLRPDLIEIDLHESKDGRFILLHDENLQKLTGVNQLPSQLTLRQLTRLKAREHGQEAHLTSFRRYLKAAGQKHQKLLVELKTTPYDSPHMLQHFNQRYGSTLVRHHDQVQSLDYRALVRLKKLNPHLRLFYLQPYNLTLPNHQVDGYAMEFSTVNQDFIQQCHQAQQPVYVWTVNSPRLMRKMMYEGVDGIVTDHVALLKKEIRRFRRQIKPADYLWHYLFTWPAKSEFES